MPKDTPISFRIPPELKAALQASADAERRSLSSKIAIVLADAMKAEGRLK